MAIAFVVEDGTGKPDANSYVTVAYADDYLALFPAYATAWAALTQQQKEAALMRSTDSLDHYFEWDGQSVTAAQALDWPRIGASDCEGDAFASDEIPIDLMRATCEFAFPLSQGTSSAMIPGLIRLQVDVIELEFEEGANMVSFVVPKDIINRLKCFGEYDDPSSGQIQFARAIRT